MRILINGNYKFEIVDKIPKGYQIWNIGANMTEGYLPLCQVYKGTYNINPDTLKAIKVDGAQIILRVATMGVDTKKKMVNYLKKYSNSNKYLIKERCKRVAEALEIMKTIEVEY